MTRLDDPKYYRRFDGEVFTFHKAYATEETANKIAEELRKSNHFGTLMGVMARVFHLPKSQGYIEYIFREPHVYRWAIYLRAYRLPKAEAESRTFISNIIEEGRQERYLETHYDQMFHDLMYDYNRVIQYKLSIIMERLGIPKKQDYTPSEKKQILKAYRDAKWVSTRT